MTFRMTVNGAPAPPDEMVAVLDQRAFKIDLYRAHDNTWRVRVVERGADRTVAGPTIQAALEAAVALRPPLPRYRRCPRHRDWEVVKDGSAWRLNCTDGSTSKWPTRKAATTTQERFRERLRADIEQWGRDIAPLTWQGHGESWLWDDDPVEMG